jgi:PAS domain-containing protein
MARLRSGDVPVGLWLWDIENDTVFADASLARYFGIDPGRAASGAPISDYLSNVHQDDREKTRQAIADAVDRCSEFRHAYRVRDDAGVWRRIAAVGNCFQFPGRQRHFFPGCIVDLDAQDGSNPVALRSLLMLLHRAQNASDPNAAAFALEAAIVELSDLVGRAH